MKVRMRAIAVILAIAMSAWFSFEAHAGRPGGGAAQSAASTISGKVYQFEKIADGVYYATSSSLMAYWRKPSHYHQRSRRDAD